jgi:hypothetical protein
MQWFKGRALICPYCLTEVRLAKNLETCPACKLALPIQYVQDYAENPPFFVQVFGWEQTGKTVFLSALTLMLTNMSKLWPRYAATPATEATQRKIREIRTSLANGGIMPDATQLGLQEVYIMMLRNMERWGGRTLVSRDCAGEHFDKWEVPIEQASYLINAPTTFMMISLSDMRSKNDGRAMDDLLVNYINTLMKYKVDFKKRPRKLVVVLTKADTIHNLPPNLRTYLLDDPIWAALTGTTDLKTLGVNRLAEYIESMARVSDTIRDWLKEDASGAAFIQLAANKNIEIYFSLISSTGSDPGPGNRLQTRMEPRRVLDPYFWAMEIQSNV